MISWKQILVPIDFGEASLHALEVAMDLAKTFQGAITIVHAWESPFAAYSGIQFGAIDDRTPFLDAAEAQLADAVAHARKHFDTTAILCRGVAWQEILGLVEQRKPDLVVMGTHGRRGIGRFMLGSVAERIVRTSPVPVLTVGTPALEATTAASSSAVSL